MLDLVGLGDYAGGVNRLRSVLALSLLVVSGALASPAQSNLGGGTPNISGTLTPNNCIKAGPGTNQIQDAGAACGSGSGTVTGVTGGSGINVSGGPPSPTVSLLNPFMGVLTINGVNGTATGGFNATNLCTGLKGVNDNPSVFVYKVVDALPYDSEAKDPWNDATCANGFSATNGALTYEFGNMNFIIGWGGTFHLPAGSIIIGHGRGSQNQLSLANGCGTGTPTQCTGTLFQAYDTVAPFTGSFAITCPGCTTFPTNLPGIDYAGVGISSFGTQLNGPLTVSMAGEAGSICVQNTGAQENSAIDNVTCVGAQSVGIDISQSTAQNFAIGKGLEVISGARGGLASAGGPGTPAAFICYKWSVNGPNRDLDNATCNPRGTATTTSIAAAVEIIGPGGARMPSGHVHHLHTENVKIAVLVDGGRNIKIDNINTGSATQDGSTPTAMVYICGVASPAPCTTGLTSSKIKFDTATIISPSLMPNYVIDDTNTRTVTAAQWTGEYDTDPPLYGSPLPATEGGWGPAPTSPNSVPQSFTSTPSGGVGVTPVWSLPGVAGRTVAGTTDTIAVTDRTSWVIYTSSSAVAVTLPQAGTVGFTSNFAYGVKVTGAGSVTITPTVSTIDGNSTLVVTQGQNCTITSIANTTYQSRCSSGQVTTGTGLASTPSANGAALSLNTALPNGETATTQADGDNTTKVASDQFVTTAVSNAIAAVNPAVAVEAASAAVLPNSPTYSNGVAGIGATLTTATTNTPLVVDGYTPILNDRILVKNQASAFQNGVYTVTQVSGVALAWILTRALDYDQPSDMNNTGAIPVVNGTVNAKTQWLQTSTVNTVGTDAVTFTQFTLNPSTQVTAANLSCQVLDNAICTTSVDASGNPNPLGTSANTVLPINGGTTPLVMFINGVCEMLSSNVTLTVSSTVGQQWILAKQDTAQTLTNNCYNMVAGNFVASLTPPVYAYTAPTCPTNPQGVAVSSTLPAYWFDLSANLSKLCTANGGAYAASPALPLGVVDVDATPKVDAVLAEPFRLNPYKRRELYGDGSNASLSVASGSNVIGTLAVATVGAAGSGYTNGAQTLTITSCGATVQVQVAGNVITGVNSLLTTGTSPCIVANGYATTGGGGTGGTLNITQVLSIPFQLTSFTVTGGTVSASDWTAISQPSNRAIGLIVFSQNPIMILNSASVNADALAKVNVPVLGSPSANETGGLGGCSGGGGGGVAAGAGGSSCEKAETFAAADNGTAGGVGANGTSGTAGPQVTSFPFANNYYCYPIHAMGASGGTGGGDGSAKKGGQGGRGGGLACLRAPSIFIASTASLTANGGNGAVGESGGGNTGGGAAGAGGMVDVRAGFLSITGATITANPGSFGNGVGGGHGGDSAAGQVIKQKLW